MKNTLLFVVLLLMLLNACSGGQTQTKRTDWDKDNLNGKVKSVKHKLYEDDSYIETTEYNENGYRVKYTPKSDLITNKYDDKGNVTETTCYDSEGNMAWKYIYKYDKNDNELEWSSYESDGSLSSKIVREYDNRGNKIESRLYGPKNKEVSKSIYKYDEKNNMIECIRDSRKRENKEIYEYDNNGNCIECIRYFYGNESKDIYEYVFDKMDNWISKTSYEDGSPTSIEEREIEYF